MPRVLPSPTIPLLHRVPGSINFPRLADSPTPPSPQATTASFDSQSTAAGFNPPHASFPLDFRHRLPSPGGSSSTSGRRPPPFLPPPSMSNSVDGHPPEITSRRRRLRQRRSLDRTLAVDLTDDLGDDSSAPVRRHRSDVTGAVDDNVAMRRTPLSGRRQPRQLPFVDGRSRLSSSGCATGAAPESEDEDDDEWC